VTPALYVRCSGQICSELRLTSRSTATSGSLSTCRRLPFPPCGKTVLTSFSMSARIAYDNTGSPYDVTRILNPDTQLDEAKYRAYSPLFLPTTFAVRWDSVSSL
jgi:hypothetical protein